MSTIVIPSFTAGQKVVSGLNTYQYTIQEAAVHLCRIEVDHHLVSQVTITINSNGSPIATMTLPGTTQVQGTAILQATVNNAVSDVITFVISSSNVDDEQLNNIKSRIIVKVGGLN